MAVPSPYRLPTTFVPEFWGYLDGRSGAAQELRRRYEALKKDAGVNSVAKDVLCQRAIFVATQLESMEVTAARTGKLHHGRYMQAINTLIGLLKCLGLEPAEAVPTLTLDQVKSRVANKGKEKRRPNL